MSSIKVKIAVTDASYFISSPNNDLPTNFQYDPQKVQFEWGGQPYSIDNYRVDPQAPDLQNWNSAIEMAYRFISVFPNETGYPDLGPNMSGEYIPYLSIDGSKSMARVVSTLGLSDTAIVDFSLIYSWSEAAASLSEPEYKDAVAEIQQIEQVVEDETAANATQCDEEVNNGSTYTWPAITDASGNVILAPIVCDSSECCSETSEIWKAERMKSLLATTFASIGVTAEDISKKHIYKFLEQSGPE